MQKTEEISLAKWPDAEMGICQISLDIANVELEAAPDDFLVFIIKNPCVRSAPDNSDAPSRSASCFIPFLCCALPALMFASSG